MHTVGNITDSLVYHCFSLLSGVACDAVVISRVSFSPYPAVRCISGTPDQYTAGNVMNSLVYHCFSLLSGAV